MATLTQRRYTRTLLGINDDELITDPDLDFYIDLAIDEDKSGGDNYAISMLAASKLVQSVMWQDVTRNVDGTQLKTADTFKKMLSDRMCSLNQNNRLLISDTEYTP
jgi:hypothetical protein